jgi:IS605 OrfB family transposase
MYQQMTALNTHFSNWLLDYPNLGKATSADFKVFSSEKFPSAITNQTIRDVKSQKKNQKAKNFKKMWCVFNSQNNKIEKINEQYIVSFPTPEKRIGVPLKVQLFQQKWLDRILDGSVKRGTIKLHERKGRWFVNISISFESKEVENAKKTMGIDVGLNYLAVASIGTNASFYNGKQASYVRRKYSSRRRSLGKLKKLNAIKNLTNKESRWMKDQNHKISRSIVDKAITNGVCLIRLEDLTGIRQTAKSSKKADRNLHSWAHYQLQEFIEYKALMAGMTVEYVKPNYTSQTCKCGHRDKKNRKKHMFKCTSCGYHSHSDVNASINIAKAISGLSKKKKAS